MRVRVLVLCVLVLLASALSVEAAKKKTKSEDVDYESVAMGDLDDVDLDRLAASLPPDAAAKLRADVAEERAKSSAFRFPEQEHFYFEIGVISFIVAYIVNFFIGKAKNQGVAEAWVARHREILCKHFTSAAREISLHKDSHTEYTVFCTGGAHMRGVVFKLALRGRHDLLSLLWELAFPSEDTVSVNVLMEPAHMDSFVFALMAEDRVERLRSEVADLRDFTRVVNNKDLDGFGCLADTTEARDAFLTQDVQTMIQEHGRNFLGVHVTDVSPFYDNGAMVHAIFRMPNARRAAEMEADHLFMRFVFEFVVPRAAGLRLTQKAKDTVERVRAVAQEARDKAELEKRREESLRKKEEEAAARLAKMAPAERKKKEERDRRKALRRRQGKGVKMVVG